MRLALSTGVPLTCLGEKEFARVLVKFPDIPKPAEDISQLRLRVIKQDLPQIGKHKYAFEVSGTEPSLMFPLVELTFPLYSPDIWMKAKK